MSRFIIVRKYVCFGFDLFRCLEFLGYVEVKRLVDFIRCLVGFDNSSRRGRRRKERKSRIRFVRFGRLEFK